MQCLRVRRGWFDRTATVLASVLLVVSPVLAKTAPPPPAFAEIGGTVVGADGLTAVAGATVKAAHVESQKVYTSAATTRNGSYVLSGLPEGWYDVAVETPKGLFVASSLIRASAGQRSMASIALGATAPDAQEPPADPNAPAPEPPKEEPPPSEPPATPPADPNAPPAEPPAPPEQQQKKKGTSFWKSPGGAAILIVGGSLLLAAAASSATDNDIDIDTPPPMTSSQ